MTLNELTLSVNELLKIKDEHHDFFKIESSSDLLAQKITTLEIWYQKNDPYKSIYNKRIENNYIYIRGILVHSPAFLMVRQQYPILNEYLNALENTSYTGEYITPRYQDYFQERNDHIKRQKKSKESDTLSSVSIESQENIEYISDNKQEEEIYPPPEVVTIDGKQKTLTCWD